MVLIGKAHYIFLAFMEKNYLYFITYRKFYNRMIYTHNYIERLKDKNIIIKPLYVIDRTLLYHQSLVHLQTKSL